MVEVKLDIPDWEAYSTEHYLSVRVGDVQKLSRISAHKTFRIPSSSVGNRRYAKVEVFRRVGGSSICIDTKVANSCHETAVQFEGNELQYNVTVNPLKGEVKAAVPIDERTPEEKSNPKLMDAKDYLERHHMEARLSEAMQALLRARPPDPALYLAQCLATGAGALEKLPAKQDPVKEELERLRGLFPGCSLDGGTSSSSTDLYPRAWVKAPPEAGPSAGSLRLHAAQFNSLADGLSGMCPEQGGFTHVPVESLAWRYRRGRLVEELFRHGVVPDVVTMQEVDHFFDWFQPVMEGLGYEGQFLAKPNSPCRKSLDGALEDGCALFWKKEVFSLRHIEGLNFGASAGKPGNQVALVAELRPVDGTHPFVLATSHLSAKKTPEDELVRARQVTELLEALRSRGLPCIVGMDMNAAPQQNSCANYNSEAYPAVLRHPVGLRSTYAFALGSEPSYTTWKRRGEVEAKHTIDFIWASGCIAVERVLAPPAEHDLAPERLPGWRYPSDHVALLAELRLPRAFPAGPFGNYVQQHMRSCESQGLAASLYAKFPPNHSAVAATAAKEARMQPLVLPFGQYYRKHVTGMTFSDYASVYNRFPAVHQASQLRVSGPEVLTGVMPHFGSYYSKHLLSSSSSAIERFHARCRQRAAEEAARKIPAPLLMQSFFLYYKRHCIPTASSSLTSLYVKFRKKPKPKPKARRTPEPLVSLSYFLYYNRYLMPSSTVSLDGIYRRFGGKHLDPKVPAPLPMLPTSPLGMNAHKVFASSSTLPPSPPGPSAHKALLPPALPERLASHGPQPPAAGEKAVALKAAPAEHAAPGAVPCDPAPGSGAAGLQDPVPLAPPEGPEEKEMFTELEALKEALPAPEEEPPLAPAECQLEVAQPEPSTCDVARSLLGDVAGVRHATERVARQFEDGDDEAATTCKLTEVKDMVRSVDDRLDVLKKRLRREGEASETPQLEPSALDIARSLLRDAVEVRRTAECAARQLEHAEDEAATMRKLTEAKEMMTNVDERLDVLKKLLGREQEAPERNAPPEGRLEERRAAAADRLQSACESGEFKSVLQSVKEHRDTQALPTVATRVPVAPPKECQLAAALLQTACESGELRGILTDAKERAARRLDGDAPPPAPTEDAAQAAPPGASAREIARSLLRELWRRSARAAAQTTEPGVATVPAEPQAAEEPRARAAEGPVQSAEPEDPEEPEEPEEPGKPFNWGPYYSEHVLVENYGPAAFAALHAMFAPSTSTG